MRLGTSSPLKHNSPEEWAQNQVKLGCSTVVFPLSCNDDEQKIIAYKVAENDGKQCSHDTPPFFAPGDMSGL